MKKYLLYIPMYIACAIAQAKVFYVVPNGAGNEDGTSWANAYADVQVAIDAAAAVATDKSPSEVWIAAGTYKHGSAMTMKNNVAIYGGFAGTETNKDQRIAGENRTYLDGEESYRVFYNNYELKDSAKLDNVTIQNGKSGSSGLAGQGGGMYNRMNASPEITNCIFYNNYSTEYGGGMYIYRSAPILNNCTFSNNRAEHGGGGIYVGEGCNYAKIKNCTFIYNETPDILAHGSALYLGYSNPIYVINCTFTKNEVGDSIYAGQKSMFYNCTITDNYRGIRVTVSDPKPVLKNCIIWNNQGGEVILDSSSYNMPNIFTNCIVKDLDKSGVINKDPKLGTLGNYGGNVQTIPVLEGSSAIKAGGVITEVTTDARGVARSTTKPTIGAYEYVTPPVIDSQPTALTIYANNSGSLSVVASGDGLAYQWYKNGEVIEGATKATLNFASAQVSDAGSYYCVVSNPAGSVQSNTATVTVKPSPTITVQPVNTSFFVNDNISLNVEASGDGLTYQWYKNGEVIGGATKAVLNFANAQVSDAGSYYCVVSNPAGSVQSSTASLVVKPAPAIGTQPSDLEIYTDKSGSLVIVATGEELTYQWYKGGAAIVGATSATLNFTNIQEASSGSYYCVVSNPGGSVQSSSATVAVRQSANAGSITKPLSSVRTVASVGFARFEIETSAYNPTYKWYWGSDTAGWTQFAGETSNTLFIPAESQYNRKSVKCEVSNGGGTAESSAVLVYSSAAVQITSQPQDVSCSAGDNVSFTVAATTSTGEAFYQWQYSANGEDWENIEGATAATHSFKMDDLSKRGYYRCEIDNGGGVLYSEKASLSCGISIITQPQDVSAFAGKEAEVSILVGEIAGIAYQWQISNDGVIWNNIAGATAAKYRFTMQTAMNGYKCRCKLSASGIDDVYSDSANITLLEDVSITQQPQVIPSAVRGSKATFSIGASGYEPQYQWQVSYDFGDTWENIAGAEGASYSITATDEIVENSYRCLVWNANNVDSPLESEMVWVEDVVDPSGYDKWAVDNGLSGDDALPAAIPHSDGIMNLEKFAFGLDGTKAASYADNPHFAQSVEGGAVSLSFPISVDAEGNVTVKALMSTDLINWTETPATATGTSKDGKFKLYKATAEIPEGGKIFLKLKVEQ